MYPCLLLDLDETCTDHLLPGYIEKKTRFMFPWKHFTRGRARRQ